MTRSRLRSVVLACVTTLVALLLVAPQAARAADGDWLVIGPQIAAGDIPLTTRGQYYTSGGPLAGTPTTSYDPASRYLTLNIQDGPREASLKFSWPPIIGNWPHTIYASFGGVSPCSLSAGRLNVAQATSNADGSPQTLVASFTGECPLFASGRAKVAGAIRLGAPDQTIAVPGSSVTAIRSGATLGDVVQHEVTLRNRGTAPWSIGQTGIGAAYGETPYFTVLPDSDSCVGKTLQPGETCSLSVQATSPANTVVEHLVVLGDAPTALVVSLVLYGHDPIDPPISVAAVASRFVSTVSWKPAATQPAAGYFIYDVTGGARSLLGTVAGDATTFDLPSGVGERQVSVVAAQGTYLESSDVVVQLPRASSTDIVANRGFAGTVAMPDVAGSGARVLPPWRGYRLDPGRQFWLAVDGDVKVCPAATERCTVVPGTQASTDLKTYAHIAAWLPDGSIAFLRGYASADRVLWTVRRDGSGLRRVAALPDAFALQSTPAGTEVVTMIPGPGHYAVNRVRLSDGVRTVVPGTDRTEDFSVSTQGRLIVTSSASQDGQSRPRTTRVMNLDGTACATIPLPTGDNQFPTFDPTGTKIAYARYTAPNEATVWVAAANGIGSREVSSEVSDWRDLIWSSADTATPAAAVTVPSATTGDADLSIAATDADSYVGSLRRECRLDNAPSWVACGSTWAVRGLTSGNHTASARATDPAGHVSAVASRTWLVDRSAPVAALTTPAATQLQPTVKLTWAAIDGGGSGVASHDLRVRTASVSGAFGAATYPAALQGLRTTSTSTSMTQGSQYCFAVRSRDNAGNVGAWSAEKCTAMVLDDRGLSASGTWTRGTSTAYVLGTYSRAASTGASLSRTSVQGRQISVVGTVCATCGYVDVYHAGVRIGRIGFSGAKTAARQEKFLPLQSATRTGTVTIRAVDSRQVYVDAIVVRH